MGLFDTITGGSRYATLNTHEAFAGVLLFLVLLGSLSVGHQAAARVTFTQYPNSSCWGTLTPSVQL